MTDVVVLFKAHAYPSTTLCITPLHDTGAYLVNSRMVNGPVRNRLSIKNMNEVYCFLKLLQQENLTAGDFWEH